MNLFRKNQKSLVIFLGGRNIEVEEVREAGWFLKFRGLMFRNKEDSKALLFKLRGKRDLHSIFVLFPFLCVWLDDKNKVVEWKVIKPFSLRVSSGKPYKKVLEIPINRRYYSTVNFIVGERFKKKI